VGKTRLVDLRAMQAVEDPRVDGSMTPAVLRVGGLAVVTVNRPGMSGGHGVSSLVSHACVPARTPHWDTKRVVLQCNSHPLVGNGACSVGASCLGTGGVGRVADVLSSGHLGRQSIVCKSAGQVPQSKSVVRLCNTVGALRASVDATSK
jgi:hypothetical protein